MAKTYLMQFYIRNEWILIQFFVKKLKDGSSCFFLFLKFISRFKSKLAFNFYFIISTLYAFICIIISYQFLLLVIQSLSALNAIQHTICSSTGALLPYISFVRLKKAYVKKTKGQTHIDRWSRGV